MADMTFHTARWCNSNETWSRIVKSSDESKQYVVRFDSTNHKNPHVQNDFSCTCPAYLYRGSYCKHIIAVKHECCRYGWQASMGSPVDMGDTCPQCGGETSVVSFSA
jgi:hypothetical protein